MRSRGMRGPAVNASMTPYARVFEEARAFTDEAWAEVSAIAWDVLEEIAVEHQDGVPWETTRARLDELMRDIGIAP
jgi:hypothetical protein